VRPRAAVLLCLPEICNAALDGAIHCFLFFRRKRTSRRRHFEATAAIGRVLINPRPRFAVVHLRRRKGQRLGPMSSCCACRIPCIVILRQHCVTVVHLAVLHKDIRDNAARDQHHDYDGGDGQPRLARPLGCNKRTRRRRYAFGHRRRSAVQVCGERSNRRLLGHWKQSTAQGTLNHHSRGKRRRRRQRSMAVRASNLEGRHECAPPRGAKLPDRTHFEHTGSPSRLTSKFQTPTSCSQTCSFLISVLSLQLLMTARRLCPNPLNLDSVKPDCALVSLCLPLMGCPNKTGRSETRPCQPAEGMRLPWEIWRRATVELIHLRGRCLVSISRYAAWGPRRPRQTPAYL